MIEMIDDVGIRYTNSWVGEVPKIMIPMMIDEMLSHAELVFQTKIEEGD